MIITGTDTGVGKTLVSALLLARMKASHRSARGFKPIATGDREDARWLHHAQGLGVTDLDTINPVWFEPPMAPMLAARLVGRPLYLEELLGELAHSIALQPDAITLIEGAGGWLSPLGEDFSTRELCEGVEGDVLVVGANRLGVLNGVRLTVESVHASRLRCAGIILSDPAPEAGFTADNAAVLKSFFPQVPVWTLPFLGSGLRPEKVHELAERHRDLLDDVLRGLLDRAGIGNKVIVQR